MGYKYVVNGVGLDAVELLVDLVVLELGFGDSYEVSDFVFDVFVVIDVEVVALVGGDFAVKCHEEGFEDGLAAFEVEIHELHPEDEGEHGTLGNPVEVD